jgi:MFS family permease
MLTDFSLLRLPNFRRLYAGQFVSGFGSALTYVVLPIEMYRLTRSAVQVRLLGVAEFVPMLVIAFAGGLLADRFDRRRLLMVTDALLSVCLAGLVINSR